MAMPFVVSVALMLAGLLALLGTTWSPTGILFVLSMVLGFFGSAFFGAGLASGVACLRDAVRHDPVLEITADGLRDPRSWLSVPWSSVRSAQPVILGGKLSDESIDLTLDRPVTNWKNPFRLADLGVRFRSKRNHLIVSTSRLDAYPHNLVLVVMTLVQWHGGQTFRAPTYTLMGRRNPPGPYLPGGIRRVDTPNGAYLEYVPPGVSHK